MVRDMYVVTLQLPKACNTFFIPYLEIKTFKEGLSHKFPKNKDIKGSKMEIEWEREKEREGEREKEREGERDIERRERKRKNLGKKKWYKIQKKGKKERRITRNYNLSKF